MRELLSPNNEFGFIQIVLLSLITSVSIISFVVLLYAVIGVFLSGLLLVTSIVFLQVLEERLLYINLASVLIYVVWLALSSMGLYKYAGFYI
jgi:hypothetical protein